jgi:hypothetical protein
MGDEQAQRVGGGLYVRGRRLRRSPRAANGRADAAPAPYAEQTCRSCAPLSTARLWIGNALLCHIKMSRSNDIQKPQGKAQSKICW